MDSEGKTVKIEARVSGSQPLTVTWCKDNSEICSSDTYDMSFVNNLAILCLRNSSRSQSGVYTCSASNEAGKASCLVSVTISGMSASHQINYSSHLADVDVISGITSCVGVAVVVVTQHFNNSVLFVPLLDVD